MEYLNQELNVKTYVDLRSYTEIKEDEFVQSGNILPSTEKVYDTQRKNISTYYFNKLYLIFRLDLWRSKEFRSVLYSPPTASSTSSAIDSAYNDGSIAAVTQRYTHFIPLVSYPQIAYGVFNYMPFRIKVSILALSSIRISYGLIFLFCMIIFMFMFMFILYVTLFPDLSI